MLYEYQHVRLGESVIMGNYFSLGMLNIGAFIKQKTRDNGSLCFTFRYGIM
ncbi:MAG: hypothetical protein ACI8P7_000940 [Candidatus Azotimanducaceae bacterium]|jgi:hypothetical protein